MAKEVMCPKCGSHKVHSYDNESLSHPSADEIGNEDCMQYDNEVYVMFECDSCGENFKKVFDMILQEKQISVVGSIKTPLEMTQAILKSINKVDAPEEVLIETYIDIMIKRHVKEAIDEYIKNN